MMRRDVTPQGSHLTGVAAVDFRRRGGRMGYVATTPEEGRLT